MKKLFASIAAILLTTIATTANAQAVLGEDELPWRIGIQLGFNVPSFTESDYNATIGWHFGANVLYDLQDFIPNSYARSGVDYVRKGASGDIVVCPNIEHQKYKFEDPTYYLHYLEVPLRFGWAYELDMLDFDLSILAETGPYFAMRLWDSQRNLGMSKWEANEENHLEWRKSTKTGNGAMHDYYDLRRFDAGWGIHLGAMIDKKYEFSIGCDWGLCNVVPYATGANLNYSIRTTVYFD